MKSTQINQNLKIYFVNSEKKRRETKLDIKTVSYFYHSTFTILIIRKFYNF